MNEHELANLLREADNVHSAEIEPQGLANRLCIAWGDDKYAVLERVCDFYELRLWHGFDGKNNARYSTAEVVKLVEAVEVKKWKAYFNGELRYSHEEPTGLVHYINYRYWTGDGLQRYADKWGGVAVFDGAVFNVVVTTEEL